MLQINKLKIMHKKDLRKILDNFSLTLNDGDKACLIGEEGNGKSTLMRWIYDPETVEEYAECAGDIITGQERLGYLPQEMRVEDKAKTVYEFFAENENFYEFSPKELAEYANRFRVSQDFFYSEQQMGSLSGGEKIKAQLIRLMMGRPTVLLLDEPSNDIDIATLDLLEDLINEWEHIVLFISHDETLIENTANTIIHIEQIMRKTKCRHTIVRVPYRQYVDERLRLFDRQEQQAENDRRKKKLRDERFRKVYQSVENALGRCSRQSPAVAKNLKDKMHTVKSMEKRFEREDENMTEKPDKEEAIFFKLGNEKSVIPSGKTVIEYKLDKLFTPGEQRITGEQRIPGEQSTYGEKASAVEYMDGQEGSGTCRLLTKNIFLRIRGSEKITIIGANGTGKTTLLKKMADELLARRDIKAQYMPQNYEELLNLDVTPVDFLDSSGEKEERTKIRTFLGALKYTADEMDHPIRELSGGQKAKVLLLKMSMADTNVLILDEPTRNFSPLSGPVIRKMIAEFPGAVISISHDRKYIDEISDRVLELTPEGLKEVL